MSWIISKCCGVCRMHKLYELHTRVYDHTLLSPRNQHGRVLCHTLDITFFRWHIKHSLIIPSSIVCILSSLSRIKKVQCNNGVGSKYSRNEGDIQTVCISRSRNRFVVHSGPVSQNQPCDKRYQKQTPVLYNITQQHSRVQRSGLLVVCVCIHAYVRLFDVFTRCYHAGNDHRWCSGMLVIVP
jgi:hypothetical protein